MRDVPHHLGVDRKLVFVHEVEIEQIRHRLGVVRLAALLRLLLSDDLQRTTTCSCAWWTPTLARTCPMYSITKEPFTMRCVVFTPQPLSFVLKMHICSGKTTNNERLKKGIILTRLYCGRYLVFATSLHDSVVALGTAQTTLVALVDWLTRRNTELQEHKLAEKQYKVHKRRSSRSPNDEKSIKFWIVTLWSNCSKTHR